MWKGSIFPGFIGFYICFVRGKHRAIIVDIVERLSKLGKALKICGEKVKNLWKKRNRKRKSVLFVEKPFVENSVVSHIFNDIFDHSLKMRVSFHIFFHIIDGVNHCRVVTIELTANRFQRKLCDIADNVNGNLPCV